MIDALLDQIAAQFDNAIFSGGLALGVFGAVAALAARLPARLRQLAASHLVTSVAIHSRDDLFDEVVAWLGGHAYVARCRRLSATLVQGRDDPAPRLMLAPATGQHVFRDGMVWLWVSRSTDDGRVGPGSDVRRTETIVIRALTRRRALLRDLLADIHRRHGGNAGDRIGLHLADSYGEWERCGRIARRPLSSLFLATGQADGILRDARQFLSAADRYVTRGIPWRRGYLLHGAPGTGKTSLVRALASELGLDLCIVNLTSSRLGDDGLATLMASAPPQAILLMEDIDAIFVGREKADAAPGLSFSGLLNAIDGVYAQEGRILVMTTNHKERLDPALIRPGRIDRHFEIGLAGEAEAVAMARAFYPDDPEMAPAVAKALAGRRITPAALQACLLAVESRPSAIGAEIERSLS